MYLANMEAEVEDAGLLIQAVALGVDHHRQALRGARWVAQAAHHEIFLLSHFRSFMFLISCDYSVLHLKPHSMLSPLVAN